MRRLFNNELLILSPFFGLCVSDPPQVIEPSAKRLAGDCNEYNAMERVADERTSNREPTASGARVVQKGA